MTKCVNPSIAAISDSCSRGGEKSLHFIQHVFSGKLHGMQHSSPPTAMVESDEEEVILFSGNGQEWSLGSDPREEEGGESCPEV